MFARRRLLVVAALILAQPPAVRAGMPAPLPTDPEQVLRLTEPASVRLQNISFFLLVLLLCTAAVWWLWNSLQQDFPKLPRLSFGKALVVVVLWGLLFIVVLTMISGARELMTPGAWQKQGFTYRLADEKTQASETAQRAFRKQHLERLRTALLQFAATHNGRFPSASEVAEIPAEQWEVPESGGLRYLYVAGLTANESKTLLAYEPELDASNRLVLWTDGEVAGLRSSEIARLVNKEDRP